MVNERIDGIIKLGGEGIEAAVGSVGIGMRRVE